MHFPIQFGIIANRCYYTVSKFQKLKTVILKKNSI